MMKTEQEYKFRKQINQHGKTLAAMGGGAGIAMMMGAI